MFDKNKYYHQYLNFDICFEKKSEIFLEIFFSKCFSNFCQFSEFQWDKDDGDVGGDGHEGAPNVTKITYNMKI